MKLNRIVFDNPDLGFLALIKFSPFAEVQEYTYCSHNFRVYGRD